MNGILVARACASTSSSYKHHLLFTNLLLYSIVGFLGGVDAGMEIKEHSVAGTGRAAGSRRQGLPMMVDVMSLAAMWSCANSSR